MKRHNAALIALLVPAFAGLVTMSAFADRHVTEQAVPAAVVNADVMGELPDGTPLPAGRLLVAELIDPEKGDETPFAWEMVQAETAAAGLASGDYYAVVTIPEDFSASIVEILGGGTEVATVNLEASNPASPVAASVSERVTQATADVLGRFLTGAYLEGSLSATGQIADAFTQAADGADQLTDGLGEATSGAEDLADGTDLLADGLFELSGGAVQVSDGAGQLAGGATEMADGVGQLADGTGALADGAGEMADGVGQLADGTTALADGVGEFAGGVHELAVASDQLTTGAGGIADGAGQLADGVGQMVDGLEQIPDQFGVDPATVVPQMQAALDATQQMLDAITVIRGNLETQFGDLSDMQALIDQARTDLEQALADGAAQARDLIDGAVGEMCATATTPEAIQICEALAAATDPAVLDPALAQALADLEARIAALQTDIDAMPTGIPEYPTMGELMAYLESLSAAAGDLPTPEEMQTYLDNAQQLIDRLPEMTAGLEELRDGADQLAVGTSEYSTGMQQFNEGMQALDTGAAELSTGAGQLADGAVSAADGADQLATGADQLAEGAVAAADGADQLADGAGDLAWGVDQLAEGAIGAANGAGRVADGTGQLADGMGQLTDGADQLGAGLREGAAQIPVYTPDQAKAMAEVLARPVSVDGRVDAADGATSVAPAIGTLVLWIGAMATYLVLDPILRRRQYAATTPQGLAGRALLPGLAFAAAQVVVLGLLFWLVGVRFTHPLTALAIAAAAAASFTMLHHGLISAFGRRAGVVLGLVLTVVQVAAMGTLLPIQTAPEIFQTLSGVLPVPVAASGLASATFGGAITGAAGVFLMLAVWALLGFGLAVAGARARQGVRVDDLGLAA